MRNILIVGAGKSSPYLIKYLTENSSKHNLHLNITDVKIDHLETYSKRPLLQRVLLVRYYYSYVSLDWIM